MPPDGVLWQQAREGDADAFAVLYERYANKVFRYCFRRTADWAVADECTSIVFLEAWRKRNDVDVRRESLLPWLLGIATNVLRNQQRSARRFRAALSRLPVLDYERDFADNVADRLDAQARMRELLAKVGRLPAVEQDVLSLCIWEGLSSEAAAEALGIPAGTVRTRLMRLRDRFRQVDNQSPAPLIHSQPRESVPCHENEFV